MSSPTLVRVPVPSTLTPLEALRTFRDDRHVVALSGRWFDHDSITLLTSEPTRVVAGPDGDSPFAVLDEPRDEVADAADGSGADRGAVGGGWFGYLGYRAGRLVERLPPGPRRPTPLPDWWLGWYDHLLRHDPQTGWWFEALWTDARADALAARRDELCRRLRRPAPAPRDAAVDSVASTPSDPEHRRAVARAIELIEAGDIYQANVCLRLDATLDGEALDLWATGVEAIAPPYAAFVDVGGGTAVASLSPEQFLRRRDDVVHSCPIKGTRRRPADRAGDAAAREELVSSAKDRAENVMIVDLVRNDLGRVCRPGSVEVRRLFDTEAHPGVWHLVSEVTGHLRPDVGDGGLLHAAFPPGSVTGAPKVRAMEVIAELEATEREVYTGAIGAVSPLAGADWNVAIRTFEVARERIWLGVGGGIVAESDPDAELEECRTKAGPLLAAIRAQRGAGWPGTG